MSYSISEKIKISNIPTLEIILYSLKNVVKVSLKTYFYEKSNFLLNNGIIL